MKHRITITTLTAASTAILFACSTNSTAQDVAKTNMDHPVTQDSAPNFGRPGVDYPAPFYIGEMNSGRFGPGYHKPEKTARDDQEEMVPRDRDYEIGQGSTDWNKERPRARATTRSRSSSRVTDRSSVVSSAPVTSEPVIPAFPADTAVNAATLADADLVSRFHLANVNEIELGRIAQERGSSPWVRALGRRVTMDNQFADSRLMTLTHKLELNVPTESVAVGASDYNYLDTSGLNGLQGEALDRELVHRIASAQAEKLQMLRGAEVQLPADSRLRELIVSFIPIVEQHGKVAANVSEKYLGEKI